MKASPGIMPGQLDLKILPTALYNEYLKNIDTDLSLQFDKLKDAEISTQDFSFYTSVASVFSSKIEGEPIDLDSFIKHKLHKVEYAPDYTKKPDDLYQAYNFAQKRGLNRANVEQAHAILASHLLAKHLLGTYRNQLMYVASADGKIDYVAAPVAEVEPAMQKLYSDIETLLQSELDMQSVFFFASLIHLVFVKIHPFSDGNGRTARLLEKWFLSQKLGGKAWFLQSEKYYYDHHSEYYNNLRALGVEYQELNYDRALAFVMMLPKALN
jgi:Fic family protein